MKLKRNEFGGFLGNSILQIAIMLWVIGELYPLLWLTFSSFKTENELLLGPFSLPSSLYLGNYSFTKWQDDFNINFLVLFKNSVFITIIGLALLVFVSILAGYALAKLTIPGKNIMLLVLVAIIAIPVQALLIPLYYFIAKIGLLNNYFGLILPLIATAAPFSVILLQAYFRTFPDELIEAAKIDGCTDIRAFLQIVLPVSIPSIVVVIIRGFISIWNMFILALIILKNNDVRTLPLGLKSFEDSLIFTDTFGPQFAFLLLTIIPSIAIFIIFSRYMVRGMSAGALKG